MRISQIAQNIKSPATLKLGQAAQELKAQDEPVIHLAAGEPKSKAPAGAIEASIAALQTAELRYTPTRGIPSLIQAIIDYMRTYYQKEVAIDNIYVSVGAKQSFYNLMVAIIDPGDEVIMSAPHWVSYPEIVKIVHGSPVIVTPASGSFVPSLQEIINACTSRTRGIIINSPNNPSGALFPSELIAELAAFTEEKGIYLIMDDIYHRLTFNGAQPCNIYEHTARGIDDSGIVVLNGVSKSYAMTGFRIGWSIANKKLTSAMVKVAAQNFSCPSIVNQAGAVGAMTGDQSGVESLRQTLEKNWAVMARELSVFSDLKLTEPQGTFYCFPDFSAYNQSSVKLAEMLLQRALVVTVPGIEFGCEGHLRISYCGSVDEIIEGISRIRWAIDPESPSEIRIGNRTMKRNW